MIPYGKQEITDADVDAVLGVLKSEFLTQGPQVPVFEELVANYVGAKFGVAVNSATSALHVACIALGLKLGDRLWTSPITFVASANCALYCGALVDFVDIDIKTFNISISALEFKLKRAKEKGELPKIIIPVHMCGQSCDMKAIHQLSKEYGFKIIEDASHAIGGSFNGELIGNCQYSDITIFSFHPVKIITTAEGGMALTNNAELAKKMKILRSHGITRDPEQMGQKVDGAWVYQQIELGFNYRMTELQAALGISQMGRLKKYVTRRHELAKRYDESLARLPIFLPYQEIYNYSSFHLYIIRLNENLTSKSRSQIFDEMRARGIGVNVHYIPVHTQPYYKKFGFSAGDFPQAEYYYAQALSIPLYSSMTEVEQDQVVQALKAVLT